MTTAVLTDSAWLGLTRGVRGRVFRPGDAGYRVHTRVFNKRFEDLRTPRGVLVAADVDDVRHALAWARDEGITPVVRSGGHSFAGYSVNDGLVLDLSRLSLVRADGESGLVTVGGGARVGHVYDAVRPYEMAFSAGTNPLVGVAGLVLGGGCEYASRRYGLTADALIATTVVTADGRVLTCSEQENPDLFWACRGGGGGNFGVNVSFTFQAQPVPDVTTFSLSWSWSDAAKVLDVLQRLVRDAPDDFATRLGVSTDGGEASTVRERLAVTAVGQYFGPANEVRALLEPALAMAQPRSQEFVERTYWDAKSTMVHATTADDFAMRTRFVTELMSGAGVDEMLSWLERWPGSSNPDGGASASSSGAGRSTGSPRRQPRSSTGTHCSWLRWTRPGPHRTRRS